VAENSQEFALTRRESLRLLGAGMAASLLPAGGSAATPPQFPKNAIVRTVLMDVPPASLAGGTTLFHEHLSLAPDFMPKWIALFRGQDPPAPAAAPPGPPYFMRDLDLMVDEMRAAASAGIACIVDAGHPDMGRDLDFLKQLSMKSGMPIVAGFGYYSQPFYPPEAASMSEDQLFHEMTRQANTQPVGALGEIGTWDEFTPDERKVFRAVSRVHLATNLPIFTHTNFGKGATEQLDLFESMGVNPHRVAIGHVGGLIDPKVEVHKAICKRGAYVGFDRQGGLGDARQIPMVLALLEAGYAGNLLFSSDFSSAAGLKRNGGAGYAQTLTVFSPKLRQAGVDETTLHGILVDNPRRFLAFVPKKAPKS
jgi:phosphotriesterase-related protein